MNNHTLKLNNHYNAILNLLPNFLFELPYKKWIIPRFVNIELYITLKEKLSYYLQDSFPNEKKLDNHIMKNMLYMIDMNSPNVKILTDTFGKKSNIYKENYFLFDTIESPDIIILETDFLWEKYIKHSIHSLNDTGHLLAIIPSIWVNKNHSMFNFLTQFHISYLHIDSSKTYFHLQKKPSDNFINIYDNSIQKYIRFFNNNDIPVYNQNFINNLIRYTKKIGKINIYKKDNFKEKSIKLTINDKNYIITNIEQKNITFLNYYLQSNFIQYILSSYNNSISSAINIIPNIIQYKHKIEDNIDQFIFQLFNISIIDIDNINKIEKKFNISINIV